MALLLSLLLCSGSAYAASPIEKYYFGEVKGGQYVNDYADFSFDLSGWNYELLIDGIDSGKEKASVRSFTKVVLLSATSKAKDQLVMINMYQLDNKGDDSYLKLRAISFESELREELEKGGYTVTRIRGVAEREFLGRRAYAFTLCFQNRASPMYNTCLIMRVSDYTYLFFITSRATDASESILKRFSSY